MTFIFENLHANYTLTFHCRSAALQSRKLCFSFFRFMVILTSPFLSCHVHIFFPHHSAATQTSLAGVRESSRLFIYLFIFSVVVLSLYDATLSSGWNGQFDLFINTKQMCERMFYKPQEDSWGPSAEQNNFPWPAVVRTRLHRWLQRRMKNKQPCKQERSP